MQLEFDESNEQRVDGAAGSEQLLGHVGERFVGLDHPSEGRDLARRSLGMAGGRSAVTGHLGAVHGWTKTAPVIPEAA